MSCLHKLWQHLLGNLVEGDVVVSVSIINAGPDRRPISRGIKGTVVHVWTNSKNVPKAYEVEFLHSASFGCHTYDVVNTYREEIELL